jgi:hypothetical protein
MHDSSCDMREREKEGGGERGGEREKREREGS